MIQDTGILHLYPLIHISQPYIYIYIYRISLPCIRLKILKFCSIEPNAGEEMTHKNKAKEYFRQTLNTCIHFHSNYYSFISTAPFHNIK